jgi:hypothetical protein
MENETVDHINGDFTDNSPENIQIVDRVEHSILDVVRLQKKQFVCPWCGYIFTLDGKKLSTAIGNRKRGKTGIFCSKRCSGKYGAMIQHGGLVIEITPINPTYTTLKLGLQEETLEVDAAKTGKP